jgi:hypothetical protein
VLGDLVDRKQSQADHAAKEEKECNDKYLSKWETLDPGADREKERAGESQRVKEAAVAEAQHYVRVSVGRPWIYWRIRGFSGPEGRAFARHVLLSTVLSSKYQLSFSLHV